MGTFELVIFIDCKQSKLYDHLSEPINMIGLQPYLTEIDVLKARKDENGITIRPFYMVETFRLLGLPVFSNRTYSVIQLTKPKDELEFHIYNRSGNELMFKYTFQQFNDGRTQVTQKMHLVKVNKLAQNIVINQARQAQRALLSNLKARLEKH